MTWCLIYFYMNTLSFPAITWCLVYFYMNTLSFPVMLWCLVYFYMNTLSFPAMTWCLVYFYMTTLSFPLMTWCLVHFYMNTLSFPVMTWCLVHFYMNTLSFPVRKPRAPGKIMGRLKLCFFWGRVYGIFHLLLWLYEQLQEPCLTRCKQRWPQLDQQIQPWLVNHILFSAWQHILC